ncbi:putative Myosin XI [Zostera marina]|uniref:Putative Myosin XI n=1 Tax=Zostera marina TaxID=29655 RepID=A0A0K9P409_ZOSMR|nr:putative Myosin XI [Zostera marina]
MKNSKWILLKMDRILGCVSWLPFLKDGSPMEKWLEYGDSSSRHRLKENKAIIIQRGWRRLIAKRRLERIKYQKSAITLQCCGRQLLARKQLQRLNQISNEAALTCQTDWRKMVARKKLQKLKRQAIAKLREEVKELKNRLESEKNIRELLENEKKSKNDMLEAYAELEEKNEKLLKDLEDSKNENDSSSTRLEETISQLKAEKQVILDTLVFLKPHEKKKSDEKLRRSSSEKHNEREELLIKCISQEIGFSNRRPIGACIVYKCLLHWGSFESEKTTIFNRIVQAISSVIEDQENIGLLAYWLTNLTMLLSLLQPLFKSGETMNNAPSSASGSPTSSSGSHNRRKTAPTSFWGRFSQSMRIPPSPSSNIPLNSRSFARSSTRHFEAKDPTIFFKNKISEFIQEIYGDLTEKSKNEISPILDLCIKNINESEENPTGDAIAQWKILVKILGKYLKTMRVNYVPVFLINKLFTEIFSYINMKLFNSLLSQPECCSFSNGRHLKDGLFELNRWISNSLDKVKGLDQMNHINQAIAFLVTDKLEKKTLTEIRDGICPSLNIGQLYKLSTMYYYDEKSKSLIISSKVISSMKAEMEEPEFSDNNYLFLLEDEEEKAKRFSEEDFYSTIKSMPIDISDVEPPPLMQHNSQFSFIKKNIDR